ncbi:MAG: glycoside hydrolase family 30 beta sandwich domain-containing protein [Mucilaginibacter sp.]|uniref:glycoside hydrolase family 30 protein n=1 Tax=Mucilaginibacter sp. TaxID=1882438 RepID=UPI0034E5E7B1
MPDKSSLFQKQNITLNFSSTASSNTTLTVDTAQVFQTIDGFGFALTGGSASLINSLNSTQQDALLKELFTTDSAHIGISYLRISIGASDLVPAPYTYDDGPVDVNLQNFSIDKEKTDFLPVLKKVLALNPNIKILATSFTAPAWMKTNNSFVGGKLNPIYYDAFGNYFVKYFQAMKAQGINIDAVTLQNEPLNPYNNPSMVMLADEQTNFIKNYVGPKLLQAGITTKIICYDHNPDHEAYADSVLRDPVANTFVDGSAFHLYAGSIGALSTLHNAFPNKNIYFTEQYTGYPSNFAADIQWAFSNLIIGATRNWSKNVLEWNLASDPNLGPHTDGGCKNCLGAVTIGTTISRNVSYYIIAHASKFVRPGAVRIASDDSNTLPNVAFKNTDGSKVLIVLNNTSSYQTFNIKFNNKTVAATLAGGAVATYIW